MLNSNVKHKEATYFAIYTLDGKSRQFKLKKSKKNLENLVNIERKAVILRKNYLLYYGYIPGTESDLIEFHILDIKNMKIKFIFQENNCGTKLLHNFNKSDEDYIKSFVIRNEYACTQYEIDEEGKKLNLIGLIEVDDCYDFRKFKNGILANINRDFYLFSHEDN